MNEMNTTIRFIVIKQAEKLEDKVYGSFSESCPWRTLMLAVLDLRDLYYNRVIIFYCSSKIHDTEGLM